MTQNARSGPAVEAPAGTRRFGRREAVLLVILVLSVVAGGVLDWILWEPYAGITISLVAVPLLVVGGIGALVTHGGVRSVLLVPFVIGGGLLLGQNLGPAREELRNGVGVMTVRLESPVVATATAPSSCTTVASGTEFVVHADPNMRLDSPEAPFLSVYADVGDRWTQRDSSPRTNGVRFEILVSPQQVPADGPSEVRLAATEGTILVADFRNDGGTIRFDGLAPDTVNDLPLELAGLAGAPFVGTVEWTCE